jgi:hypothetical protein
MSRGAADDLWESLEIKENISQHVQHYTGARSATKSLICWSNRVELEAVTAGLWSLMSGSVVVMAFEAFIRA